MNILFVVLMSYGCVYGFHNLYNKVIAIVHGKYLHQSVQGRVLDNLFLLGIIVLVIKCEEVTLWGLL